MSACDNNVTAFARKCEAELKAAGLSLDECIACGGEGCVFRIDDKRVLKLVIGEREARFSDYLMYLGRYPKALPKIYGVWRMPRRCTPEWEYPDVRVYAILREDIPDLADAPDRGADLDQRWDNINTAIQALFILAGLVVGVGYTKLPVKEFEARIKELPVRARLSADDTDRYYLPLVDLAEWLIDKDLVIDDMGLHNLGERSNGTIVVRDLGRQSTVKRDFEFSPELIS